MELKALHEQPMGLYGVYTTYESIEIKRSDDKSNYKGLVSSQGVQANTRDRRSGCLSS
jgi:hypothetical protein